MARYGAAGSSTHHSMMKLNMPVPANNLIRVGQSGRIPDRFDKFPDRARSFPDRSKKFPVPLSREFLHNPLRYCRLSNQSSSGKAQNGKIPCNFPCYQGIRAGEGFARDCVLQRGVMRTPDWKSARGPQRRLLRAPAVAVNRTGSAGFGASRPASNAGCAPPQPSRAQRPPPHLRRRALPFWRRLWAHPP